MQGGREGDKQALLVSRLSAAGQRCALMSIDNEHPLIPCLGKHGVAQLIAQGGPCPRHAIADDERGGRQRQHARHSGGGEGCGVGGQAVYGVFQQEGNLQRPEAGQSSGSGKTGGGGMGEMQRRGAGKGSKHASQPASCPRPRSFSPPSRLPPARDRQPPSRHKTPTCTLSSLLAISRPSATPTRDRHSLWPLGNTYLQDSAGQGRAGQGQGQGQGRAKARQVRRGQARSGEGEGKGRAGEGKGRPGQAGISKASPCVQAAILLPAQKQTQASMPPANGNGNWLRHRQQQAAGSLCSFSQDLEVCHLLPPLLHAAAAAARGTRRRSGGCAGAARAAETAASGTAAAAAGPLDDAMGLFLPSLQMAALQRWRRVAAQQKAAGRLVGSRGGGLLLLARCDAASKHRQAQVRLFVLWPHRMQLAGGRGADGSCRLPRPSQGAAAACAATAARPACVTLHSTHTHAGIAVSISANISKNVFAAIVQQRRLACQGCCFCCLRRPGQPPPSAAAAVWQDAARAQSAACGAPSRCR